MRSELWPKVVGGCVAALALVASVYFFSLGVLFDSGCHMGDEAACFDKARTLRLSLVLAIVFVVAAVLAGTASVRFVLRRRRRSGAS